MSDKMLPPEAPSYGELLDEIERLRNDVQEAQDKTAETRTAWKYLADENERLRAALAESCDENRHLVLEEGPWSTDMCPIAGKLSAEIRSLRAALERIADTTSGQVTLEKWNKIAREALKDG